METFKLKKNKISKSWINKQHRDPFFKSAKASGYRSRSAFKLIDMNKKFRIFKRNTSFLDLGASPGGWSQVASQEIKNGKILSVDIKNMEYIKNVNFILGDFLLPDVQRKIINFFDNKIDIVASDMAADTTGNKSLDSFRTGELCIKAMLFASNLLNDNGIFIAKFFMGSEFKQISKISREMFKKVENYKPSASRSESRELYLVCKKSF